MIALSSTAIDTGVRVRFRAIASPTHAVAGKVIGFWQNRLSDGLVMGRDVPSRAMASLLSRSLLQEPIDGGHDMKIRLAGDEVQHRCGVPLIGHTMSELFSPEVGAVRARFVMKAIREEAPQFAECSVSIGQCPQFRAELVILPIFAANRVDRLALAVCCFFD